MTNSSIKFECSDRESTLQSAPAQCVAAFISVHLMFHFLFAVASSVLISVMIYTHTPEELRNYSLANSLEILHFISPSMITLLGKEEDI